MPRGISAIAAHVTFLAMLFLEFAYEYSYMYIAVSPESGIAKSVRRRLLCRASLYM